MYRYTLFLTSNPYDLCTAKFREKLSLNSSERPRFARLAAFGVASYGRGVGRLPPLAAWVAERRCRQLLYKRLAVAAALRTLPVIPNFRRSPLKMGPRVSREPSPRGGGDIAEADSGTHLEGHQPTSTRRAGWAGCPIPGFQAHPPRERHSIREPHSQTVSRLSALRARCHYGGHFLCFPKSLPGFQELTRDDLNLVSLGARAPSCAVAGAPCPRASPISGGPQPGSTGKQSGFQCLGILLLLRENITKFVRPRARYPSRIQGLTCTEARSSRTFLGLVDGGGGPVLVD